MNAVGVMSSILSKEKDLILLGINGKNRLCATHTIVWRRHFKRDHSEKVSEDAMDSLGEWEDVDKKFECDVKSWGLDTAKLDLPAKSAAPKCIFRAYLEDWEPEAIKTKDDETEYRLLNKYAGLHLWDPDDGVLVEICMDNLEFHTKKRKGSPRGWKVLCSKVGVKLKNDEDYKPWNINDELIGQIATTPQPQELNVTIV